jgi:hypothetical protein
LLEQYEKKLPQEEQQLMELEQVEFLQVVPQKR